jgi:hypothetical protein
MEFVRSKLTGIPYLVAGGSYLVLHFSLLYALAWLFEGNPGSLVATRVSSLAYFVLITLFGGIVVALSLQRVGGYLRLVSLVVLLALLGSRFVLGSVTAVNSVVVVFTLVFLPYVVGLGVLLRLVIVRVPFSWFAQLPSRGATVRVLLVTGLLLTGTVGGAVFAVAAAPSPVPPADWSADRQLDYLERTDQADRETGALVDRSRDYRRAERVLELLAAGRVDSPDEWLSAAIVLQHGSCADHFQIAHRLATAANESPGIEATQWTRVTYDRWQVAMGNEQRYGTQTGTRRVGEACYPPIPTGLNASNPLGLSE